MGSRLNVKRKGFQISRTILNNEASKVIAYLDKLVRFGFEMEEVCKAHNRELPR